MNQPGRRRVDVAYVLIYDRNTERVLMVLNDHGSWSLPGGGREPGESLAETARREALEETGLEACIGPVVHVSERLGQTHDLFVTFRGEIVGGTLGADLLSDVRQVSWKDLDEAQRLMPYYDDLRGMLTASPRTEPARPGKEYGAEPEPNRDRPGCDDTPADRCMWNSSGERHRTCRCLGCALGRGVSLTRRETAEAAWHQAGRQDPSACRPAVFPVPNLVRVAGRRSGSAYEAACSPHASGARA